VNVVRAYLAEHKPDDDEPTDEAFVRSLGTPIRDDRMCVMVAIGDVGGSQVNVTWDKALVTDERCASVDIWRESDVVFIYCPTRGKVRRLCRELGCKLKEPA
jgi:hypothetical protein